MKKIEEIDSLLIFMKTIYGIRFLDQMSNTQMTMSKFVELLFEQVRQKKYIGPVRASYDSTTCTLTDRFKGFSIVIRTDFVTRACVRYKWEECEYDYNVFEKKWAVEKETDIMDQLLKGALMSLEPSCFRNFLAHCKNQFKDENASLENLYDCIQKAQDKGRNIHLLKYYKAYRNGIVAVKDTEADEMSRMWDMMRNLDKTKTKTKTKEKN